MTAAVTEDPQVGDVVKYWSGFNMRESKVVRMTATQCHLADKTVIRKTKLGVWRHAVTVTRPS